MRMVNVSCPVCNGTGKVINQSFNLYNTTGSRQEASGDATVTTCATCRGTGTVTTYHWDTSEPARIGMIDPATNQLVWKDYQAPIDPKVKEAIDLILHYGGIDGEHHKQWLLDQVLQVLAGDTYPTLVDLNWDQGIMP